MPDTNSIEIFLNNIIHSKIRTPQRVLLKKKKNLILNFTNLNNETFKATLNKIKTDFYFFKVKFLNLILKLRQNNFYFAKIYFFEKKNLIKNVFETILNYFLCYFKLQLSFIEPNKLDLKFLHLHNKIFNLNKTVKKYNFNYVYAKKNRFRLNSKVNDKLFMTFYSKRVETRLTSLGKELIFENSFTDTYQFLLKFNLPKQFLYYFNLKKLEKKKLALIPEELFDFYNHFIPFKSIIDNLPFVVAEKSHLNFYDYNKKASFKSNKFEKTQLSTVSNVIYIYNNFSLLNRMKLYYEYCRYKENINNKF